MDKQKLRGVSVQDQLETSENWPISTVAVLLNPANELSGKAKLRYAYIPWSG